MSKKFSRLSSKLKLGLTFFFLAVSCYFKPSLFFVPLAWPLVRDDHPALHADAVVVLMGGSEYRPTRAAHAVLEGYGPRLVMVDSESSPLESEGLIPKETTLATAMAERAGLSRDKIFIIGNGGRATSTADEARSLADWVSTQHPPIKRLVIVTSWPHTSRAGWIMEKALGPKGVAVDMLPVDNLPYTIHNWWHFEPGLLFVFEEYVKWVRYIMKYSGREISPPIAA